MLPVFNEFAGTLPFSEETATSPCPDLVKPTSHDYTHPVTAAVQLIAIRCVEYLNESLSKTEKIGKSVYVQDL